MAAEQASLGFFERKRKREQDFAAACTAMEWAISNSVLNNFQNSSLSYGSADEAVDVLEQRSDTPLLSNMKLTQAIAYKILDEVKKLQVKNPMSTEFLTNVLNVTAEYIRNPNSENLGKYKNMREQVATKYGRHSALSGLLFGLPISMVIGGIIGAAFLCAAFPAFIPLITVLSFMVTVAATGVGTVPVNKAVKIALGWDSLNKELNQASSQPSRGR
ncbi:MAG: hypothetical protein SFW07_05930 [Gammaproteobacteria bacterium]|nr:hypothetical protein [Gammaproteobacteria bacterium]